MRDQRLRFEHKVVLDVKLMIICLDRDQGTQKAGFQKTKQKKATSMLLPNLLLFHLLPPSFFYFLRSTNAP